MINISNLSKSFDKKMVLNQLEFSTQKGSINGLVGINGAGKTTLLKILSGVIAGDCGSVTFEEKEIWENPDVKQKISLMMDVSPYWSGDSIGDVAKFLRGIYKEWNDERYNQMLQAFNLSDKIKFRSLSKGVTKQAQFVLVMSTMPALILLDEPVDGLDPIARKVFWDILCEDVAERESTVIISSHNLKEIEGICDTIAILNNGKIQSVFSVEDISQNINKVQIAFTDNAKPDFNGLNIAESDIHGNLYNLIVRNSEEEISKVLEKQEPVVLNIIPMSLDEYFSYEIGGEHNESNY